MIFSLGLIAAGCGGGSSGSQAGSNDSNSSGGSSNSSGQNGSAASAHHRCGWIEQNDSAGAASFVAHASFYDEIHPLWWHLSADGQQLLPYAGADDAQIAGAAQQNHVRLMPLVFFDDVSGLRAMLSSPGSRSQKVSELVGIAQQHHYDGLEIDFEQLFDGGDRAGYTAFMTELAQALHGAGLKVSAAVPALGTASVDEQQNAYDYAALSQSLDRIHLMGYDFHGSFSDHAGPIAPLGWIRGVLDHVQQTGRAEVFTLALANYSVTPGTHRTADDAKRLCGTYDSTDQHMASCPYGHFDAGLAPHCSIGGALTYFEDSASITEKIQLAKQYGIGGFAYYPLGGEQSDLWSTVARYY
jgi:spore germination protein YaaH